MSHSEEQRRDIRKLSTIDLLDELQRPTGDWQKDVNREALYRILKRMIK